MNKIKKMSFNELKDFITTVPAQNKESIYHSNLQDKAEYLYQDSSKPLWSVVFDKIFQNNKPEEKKQKKHKHKNKVASLDSKNAHNCKMSSNDYDRESIRSSEYPSSNRSRSRDDVRSKNASRHESHKKKENTKDLKRRKVIFKTAAQKKNKPMRFKNNLDQSSETISFIFKSNKRPKVKYEETVKKLEPFDFEDSEPKPEGKKKNFRMKTSSSFIIDKSLTLSTHREVIESK